ncbi:hypothetical protein DOM01_00495, partial [Salmonella enterica subsp. enterica serovar Derby]
MTVNARISESQNASTPLDVEQWRYERTDRRCRRHHCADRPTAAVGPVGVVFPPLLTRHASRSGSSSHSCWSGTN